MASETTDQDLIQFVRSNIEPLSIDEMATDLETLGRSGADWTRASKTSWKREINRLIHEGKLLKDDEGRVSCPAEEKELTQGTLF